MGLEDNFILPTSLLHAGNREANRELPVIKIPDILLQPIVFETAYSQDPRDCIPLGGSYIMD